jgi:hypothetical protein
VRKQGTEVVRIARVAKIELNMIKEYRDRTEVVRMARVAKIELNMIKEYRDQSSHASSASCFAGLFVVG